MKRIRLVFLLLYATFLQAQIIYNGYDQRWELVDIELDNNFTALLVDITITTKKAGCFDAHTYDKRGSSIYIYGDFGYYKLYKSTFTGNYEPWDNYGAQWNYFEKRNLGKVAHAVFYFPRLPAGVTKFSLYFNGGEADESAESDEYHCPIFEFSNISLRNNPNTAKQTEWTERKLKEYWTSNRCASVEGIYNFFATSNENFWGTNRHKIAVKKSGEGYQVIYLKGSNEKIWQEGEEKGFVYATATKGLYTVDEWLQDNKMPTSADFYVEYKNRYFTLFDSKTGVETQFLKYFPATDIEEMDDDIITTTSNNQVWKWSGSGFFISEKGYIATNYHVVDGANTLEVQYYQKGVKYAYNAEVVLTDPTNDLAIIKITDNNFHTIPQIPYAINVRTIDVGTEVFALGYPMSNVLGQEIKFSDGKISARTGIQGDVRMYQISVPINHGNSGGPLFDNDGNLVGITSSGMDKGEFGEVNYAIKVAYLKQLIEVMPENIMLPYGTNLASKPLTEKIKILSEFIPQIFAK